MDKKEVNKLIERYLRGECSPEEEQKLLVWYENIEDESEGEFTETLNTHQKHELEESMFHAIMGQGKKEKENTRSLVKKIRGAGWFKLAACVVLLMAFLPFYWKYMSHKNSFKTAFGEVKSLVLPDQSEVVLNGNSKITYKDPTDSNDNREVWLDGEASFHVTGKQNKQRFIVHLADTLSIEVIGTEFNVMKRPSGTQIALKSGKVKLHYHNRESADKIIEMMPNEVVSFKKHENGFVKKITPNIVGYFAWQQKKILLNNTSLAEISDILHETYGIKIFVLHDSILSRSASGSVPIDRDGGQLLKNISELYGLAIIKMNEENEFTVRSQ